MTWDSADNPQNPKNCNQVLFLPSMQVHARVFLGTMKRTWAALTIVACFTFVSPVSSSLIAPPLSDTSNEFDIMNSAKAQLTLPTFIPAYAIGPMFFGPRSGIYGRVIILQLSNLFLLAWNLECGFVYTSGQLMACRFFSRLGASAPLAIGGGDVIDQFPRPTRQHSLIKRSRAF